MTAKNTKTEIAPGVEVSDKELADAKKDGALDYVKEGSGRAVAANTGTDGDTDAMTEAEKYRVAADLHSTTIAPLLNLPADELACRLGNDKVEGHIDFETAKGLLHLERSGLNRTNYVKMLCGRIGVDDPRKVTSAGPSYTNDETAVTDL